MSSSLVTLFRTYSIWRFGELLSNDSESLKNSGTSAREAPNPAKDFSDGDSSLSGRTSILLSKNGLLNKISLESEVPNALSISVFKVDIFFSGVSGDCKSLPPK
ncbi:unnamed protein product [Meganyctiphanes norvegica]|uniref:Uncharacterized protein n=1 Tax=Meganyctiphanes norvegica TaxID=48144 RepID=A0AAV2PY65_MEGNR